MHKVSHLLPPLEPLVAFEAAARHNSFTRAAAELHLSQAAVSQRIRALEARLGVKLFEREHRTVRLTPAGKEYQHTVSGCLRQLAMATVEVSNATSEQRLTIAADHSIASLLLLPRLLNFQAQHAALAVRVISSDHEAECLSSDVDVAILHGGGTWPGYRCRLLFPEEIFPVCSPGYLKQSREGLATELLVHHVLLELENSHWDWVNWRAWLSGNGVDLPTRLPALKINNYPLLIEAARRGQGIALGWRYLIDDALHDGSLVRIGTESLSTEFGYYLVWPETDGGSPLGDNFRNWAIEQLGVELSEKNTAKPAE